MKYLYKNFLILMFLVTVTGSIHAQTQLVTDGGFEAGAGSGAWNESSTTWSTPICSLVGCGNGSGTGPHTGSYFAWFGGVSGAVETASLSQNFVIPLGGTVTLKFWIEQILCDSPQDFIEVKIDGNVLFTSDGSNPLCGVFGYTLQTINLTPYADGLIHMLSFNATTFSANLTESNFFIDDVSVIHTSGSGGSACADTTIFGGLAVVIPDGDPTGITNSQTISGVTGTLGVDVQLKSVCFKIDHTWVGDLLVKLIAPNGTEIILTDLPGIPATVGGCGGDNLDVCVDVGIGNEMESICSNLPAISGSYTAANGADLNDINVGGGPANGTWQLFTSDNNADDTGSIIEWSLVFDDGPVASWTSPGTICATSGTVNLDNLVTGTPGGIWSGTGVIGSVFNPTGLSGPYNINYLVANLATGCSDSQTNTITVVPPAVASFTFTTISLTAIFSNISTDGNTYQWNFGDTNTSTEESPMHTYAASGIYPVSLTVTNACGSVFSIQNVTVLSCPDMVTDGGFEAGTGSGAWTETSTNFNTPICDTLNCGNGGGSGPKTGASWVLFGGVGQFEESSVSQTVTIAINSSATLYFWLEIPSCDSQDDILRISVDADTVYSINGANNNCGNVGYNLQNVNLDAYDDGLPHTVKFLSTVYGNNGGITSFFVDDIALIVCLGMGFSENNLNRHVDVMPVPAHDYLNINFNDLTASNVLIEVTDMLGKNIYNSTIQQVSGNQSEMINVSGWRKGVYMLKVSSGNNTTMRKIVIQ